MYVLDSILPLWIFLPQLLPLSFKIKFFSNELFPSTHNHVVIFSSKKEEGKKGGGAERKCGREEEEMGRVKDKGREGEERDKREKEKKKILPFT